MQKLLGILFMILYGAETLLCPLQDYTALKSLPQIYSHCKTEDPDMNAADFVFEHLMDLECILSFFENNADKDKNEKPHQPLQQQSLAQHPVIVSKPLYINHRQPVFFAAARQVYPICREDFIPSHFLKEIFHPPSILV